MNNTFKLGLLGGILYVLIYTLIDLFTPVGVFLECIYIFIKYIMNDELCFGATLISSGMYFISPVVIAVMVGLLLHKWGKSSLEPLIPAFSIQAGVLGLLIVSSVLGIFELRSNIIYTAKVVEYIILYTGLVVLYIYPGRFLLYSLCVYHLLGVLFLMNALFAAWYSFSSALVPSISIRATAIPLLLLGWQVTRGRG